MAFPNNHLYLTVHWHVSSSAVEEGQFGLRFDRSTLPDSTAWDLIWDRVGDFWALASAKVPDDYRLDRVKCAIIDTTGHYPDDHEPLVHDFSPVIPGGVDTTIFQYPLQIACVSSLTTASARGRAHRGRAYLPPLAGNLSSSFQWSATDCQSRADQFRNMMDSLKSATMFNANPVVMSSIGAGTKKTITGIAVGTRPDVQRRRAGEQVESYSTAALT